GTAAGSAARLHNRAGQVGHASGPWSYISSIAGLVRPSQTGRTDLRPLADAEAGGGREDHNVARQKEVENHDSFPADAPPAAATAVPDGGAEIDQRLATAPVSITRLVLR